MACRQICAFCRHWKAGTISLEDRKYLRDIRADRECHVKQPAVTSALSSCGMFEPISEAK